MLRVRVRLRGRIRVRVGIRVIFKVDHNHSLISNPTPNAMGFNLVDCTHMLI